MGRTRKEMFVVIVVDECFGDEASSENRPRRQYRASAGSNRDP
jgi:hypothetical protein